MLRHDVYWNQFSKLEQAYEVKAIPIQFHFKLYAQVILLTDITQPEQVELRKTNEISTENNKMKIKYSAKNNGKTWFLYGKKMPLITPHGENKHRWQTNSTTYHSIKKRKPTNLSI